MPSIINATTTNGVAISPDNSGSLQLATNNGTTAVTIDTSQNVGIGTSSPANPLAIYRGSGVASFIDLIGNGNTAGTSNVVIGQNSDDGGYFWNRKASFLSFGTSNTERMRITSGGDVLVNSTTAGLSGAGCQIIKYANGNYIDVGHTTGDTGSEGYIRFIRNGTTVGQVQSNGTTQVSYSTSSDYRLKENVAPMTGALAKVQQLKPVTYTWKSDGSAGQGFIAHELQAVVPDCVTGEKDAVELVDIKDEEGNVIGQEEKPVYQGVDTSFLVATLTAAIQEQQAQIEELKAKVSALEGAK